MTPRQLGALLFAASVWGGSFLFIRVLVDAGVEPAGVSAGRCLFGLAALAPFAWLVRRQFPRRPATLAAIAVLGVVNMALPWTFFAVGEQDVPSGMASIVNSTMPLWTAIFATVLVRGESLRRTQVFGLLAGFGGVVALVGGDFGETRGDAIAGIAILLLATMCYGISAVSIRRWLRHVPAVPLTIGQVATAAVVLTPLAVGGGAFDGASMGAAEWASLATLGAAGSGFASLAYMWLLGQVGAVRAAVVTYLLPPAGVFLGWLALDEAVGLNLLAGIVLVVAGVALVQGAPVARLAGRLVSAWRVAPAPAGD